MVLQQIQTQTTIVDQSTMGLKLHGSKISPNVARVITVLNEKGLDFEFVSVDMQSSAHKQPPFLKLNPFGQVPAFEDGEIKLFESRAICRYIATKYKEEGTDLLPAKTLKEVAATELWLEVESQHFYQPVYGVCLELLVKPVLGMATDEAEVEKNASVLDKVLDVYEERLSGNKYLAGEDYTLADCNHVSWLSALMMTGKATMVASRPNLMAWWKAISARPAWQKTASI